MADSSRAQVRYSEESTFGTTPATAMQNIRVTSESLNYNINKTPSNEIQEDRQVRDLIATDASSDGALEIELSYGNTDAFIEGALQSTFAADLAISNTDISAVASDNSINSVAGDFTNVEVGQWIKIAGFTESANNGFAKVLTQTSTKLTLSGLTIVDKLAGDTVTVNGQTMKNGVTGKSFSIEKEFSDITKFFVYRGMRVGSMSFNFANGSVATQSVNFQGSSHATAGTSFGTGAATAAPTKEVMNGVDNVLNIQEGGSAITQIQSLSLNIENNLRAQNAIGNLEPFNIGSGRCNVTGNTTIYFQDTTIYDKYINNTESSIDWRVSDAAGNTYIFTLPAIKYEKATVVAGGNDSDVMVELDYQAIMHATLGYTIRIDKIAA